jgi:hypothetical protein
MGISPLRNALPIMHPTFHQEQIDLLVQRASELLRAPGKAVTLDCVVEEKLLKLSERQPEPYDAWG